VRKILLTLFGICAPVIAWAAAPTIDGTTGNSVTGGTTITVTVSTTNTNDIMIAAIEAGLPTDGASPQTYTVSGCGLTWTLRKRTSGDAVSSGYPFDQEVWWAKASTALSSCVVTATSSLTQDDALLSVFGVNGVASLTAPFDANGSLSAVTNFNTTGSAATTATYSTTSANDFIFYVLGSTSEVTDVTGGGPTPSGTVTYNTGNSAGAHYAALQVAYQTVTSVQTSAAFGSYQGSSLPFVVTVDALAGTTSTNKKFFKQMQ
jgi:hypothetical protein